MRSLIIFALIIIGLADTMHSQNNKVQITAHRGASGHAPENTIASVKEAVRMKADFVEIDVQETADGELVLFHDRDLKRITGLDKNIWETSFDEINSLDAGNWFNVKFKGEPVPTFADFIDFAKGKIKVNIELKTNGYEKLLAEKTVRIAEEKGFTGDCFYTSFSYGQIKRVKEINPAYKVGLIFKTLPEKIDVFSADIELLSAHFSLIDDAFVYKAKTAGKEIHVWTVNDEAEMKRLINLGVTSIITNYPDLLFKVLNESN
jgi:glycerophosphoryl diester phosphodiesterase